MLTFEPLSANMGARVHGLDLNRAITADEAEQLHDALYEHRLLLFRQGPITDEQHIALMRALGNVIVEVAGGNEITYIDARPDQGYVSGSGRLLFHADGQFTDFGPLQAISLYAVEMDRTEPTIFADMVAAARRLPEPLRQQIAQMQIVQCADMSLHVEKVRMRLSSQKPHVPDSQFPRAVHPALGKHLITGEPLINICELFTSHVVGMDDAQSDEVFAALEPYQYHPDYLYAHPWELHDLVVWDNMALNHARGQLAESSGRRLRRVSINPIGNDEMMRGVKADPALLPGFGEGWK